MGLLIPIRLLRRLDHTSDHEASKGSPNDDLGSVAMPSLCEQYCGSVAESMGRIVGETPLPVEESESGTVPRGMPAPASGTPSPNPWDLSLSRQNVLFYAEGT